MRIVFMGSPAFAVPALERLTADGHLVPLAVTQPDRPAGRGQGLRPPAVKTAAGRLGIPVLQPERVLAARDEIAAVGPELIVVVAFGQYLPEAVRTLAPRGCINVHASLLPKYRGAAPIPRALMDGETETGVTIMRVERAMDAGPILLQRQTRILPPDDAGTLSARLAGIGADALSDAVRLVAEGRAVWTPQEESGATLAPKLTDADCRLVLAGDPGGLANRIRGLAPEPGADIVRDGRRLRLLAAEPRPEVGAAGQVLGLDKAALVVGTGGGALALLAVQPEGKRRMTGAEFARGRRLTPGDSLG
jgi:methionyl-tRNA formyltransferase